MQSKRLLGLILLIGGLALLYVGYQSSQGLDDQVSRALTGRFTEQTIVYYVVGGICAILGLVALARKR